MQRQFSIAVAVDNASGRVISAAFLFKRTKIAKTKELADGRMIADYDARGHLVGVEILAPCTAQVLNQIEIDEPSRAFLNNAMPLEFVRGRLPNPKELIGSGC